MRRGVLEPWRHRAWRRGRHGHARAPTDVAAGARARLARVRWQRCLAASRAASRCRQRRRRGHLRSVDASQLRENGALRIRECQWRLESADWYGRECRWRVGAARSVRVYRPSVSACSAKPPKMRVSDALRAMAFSLGRCAGLHSRRASSPSRSTTLAPQAGTCTPLTRAPSPIATSSRSGYSRRSGNACCSRFRSLRWRACRAKLRDRAWCCSHWPLPACASTRVARLPRPRRRCGDARGAAPYGPHARCARRAWRFRYRCRPCRLLRLGPLLAGCFALGRRACGLRAGQAACGAAF